MNKNTSSQGLIHWFINNHVAANILMFLLVIGGIISVNGMRTETFPTVDPRIITVSVNYPGATPDELADSVTGRVEDALVGIEGVKRVSSRATENIGTTTVELSDFVSPEDVYNEVETAVNGLIDFPPQNAERPIITRVRVTPTVVTLAIHGDVEEKSLKYWAETIEEELQLLEGVAVTNLRGIRNYQISIEIAESSLRKYNLSFNDITNAIRNFSEDVPAGTIESSSGDILFRVQEKRFTGKEYEEVPIKTLTNGSSLKIKDIGTVIDGFEDVNIFSRFNNERAAFIDVKRSESDDTIAVANQVKEYLNTVKIPTGMKLSLQQDETVVLEDRISLMLRNGILGFALVFLILLVFLDLKLAFWTSAAIPISFLGGLMILEFMGYSLNMISLFAMIVVLGIVVDDGIVTAESIYDSQIKRPNDPDAVHKGVMSVIAPVTVGVTTTMAAFAPLIFSTGTLGQIIGVVPVVVIAILFVSLIEAYFILPAHLSGKQMWSSGVMASIRNKFASSLESFTQNTVAPLATLALKWRYATIAAFLGLAIITGGLLKSGTIRFVFFPQIESDIITINVNMPVGTPFDVTKDSILLIESHIFDIEEELDWKNDISPLESVSVSVGESSSGGAPGAGSSGDTANNIGQIIIKLVPSDFRLLSSMEIESIIRAKVDYLPNIEKLEFNSSLFGDEPDIDIELSHSDETQLREATEDLMLAMNQLEGTIEVSDTFDPGKTEYLFSLNEQGLAVGLTPSELGSQLRSAYFGSEVVRFQRGRSEMTVYVRYPKSEREDISGISETRIRLSTGEEASLSTITDIQEQEGYSQILSVDGKRIVGVTADVDTKVTTPGVVLKNLETKTLPSLISKYPGLDYSFAGESRDQNQDLSSLGKNMVIALMLIYVLLGAQLRSYIQPLIIMSAIPFGIVGAILGHFTLGYDLTFISLFGMVALSGVVINDSVVLIDYLNSHLSAGKSLAESAVVAVKRRFRPILLTTLSTCLGLLPMLLETSIQAEFLIPMVVSLSTGILFVTFVILLLVPCLILIVNDLKNGIKRIRHHVNGTDF